MPDLPGFWSLTPIGALVGVVVLAYWLLATGRVIARSTHVRELAMSDKRGDEWKETAKARQELIEAQTVQITALTESAKTAAQFFGTVTRGGGHEE